MQKRINAMEHPAYNTLTLQEKLQMPEVRWSIFKAIVATIIVSLVSFSFAVVSVWIMLAVPIWYREYDELYADLWKDTVGCYSVGAKPWITVECSALHFNMTPSLDKTFERTLSEFVLENPHSKYVLVDLLRCHNAGQCKSTMISAINLFIQTRIWVLIVSWIPTVWGALLLIQRCMMPYWNKVWFDLTRESAIEVKWGAMKESERDHVLRDIVSPPIPLFPSDQWTTAPISLDRAGVETTSEDDDLSSMSSRHSYCADESKLSSRFARPRARKPQARIVASESNATGGRADD